MRTTTPSRQRFFSINPIFVRIILECAGSKYGGIGRKLMTEIISNRYVDREKNSFKFNRNDMAKVINVNSRNISSAINYYLSRDVFRFKEKDELTYTFVFNPHFFQNEDIPNLKDAYDRYKKLPYVKQVIQINGRNKLISTKKVLVSTDEGNKD